MAQLEDVWMQLTEAAMIHGFGEGSHNVSNYYMARAAGIHSMMGTSDHQRQLNYNRRIEEFEANVLGSIAELEASIPEAELRGAYENDGEKLFGKKVLVSPSMNVKKIVLANLSQFVVRVATQSVRVKRIVDAPVMPKWAWHFLAAR